MTPCACHCTACRAAGHSDGACVVLCAGLHALFDGKADVVDQILRHCYGACGWGTARLDAAIMCVQYGPAGDVIAAGDFGGRIHFLCAQTGEKILCPRGHTKDNEECTCEHDLFGGDDEVGAGIYEANPDCPENVDGSLSSIDFAPCSNKLAAAFNIYDQYGYFKEGGVKIFSNQGSAGFVCQSTLRGHGDAVSSLAFRPDDPNVLVTGSWDKTVKLWDLSTSTCLSTMRGHNHYVSSLAFKPDDPNVLVTGAWDKTVKLWDLSSLRCRS